nr:T9SS sorting signal type C domain-containing protein [uncultured Flavobacterium sp.]
MKKRLLNRKRLLQFALSLCLILVSANTSWGQTITVPNGDFSSGSTLTGTSPWTIPGWTISQNTGIGSAGNANLTVGSSGVIGGALNCTGVNSTSGANANAIQAALIVESDKIDISSYAGSTTAFTYAFQIKVATATTSAAPWNVVVKVYDASNVEVLSAISQTKSQGSLKTTAYGTYVNASVVGTLLGAPSANVKYITIQVHLGQVLANTPTLDTFTLNAAGAAASTTLTQPVSTALSYEIGNGPSAEQSFQVAGANLGSNNVTVTPGANIELSSTSGSGFGSSPITLTQSSGTVATTTLYARLIAGLGLGSGGSNAVRQVNVAATGTTTKTVQFTAAVNGINTTGITGSDLSYVAGSGPSAEGSFTFTTNGLTSDLVVTPGSDLEVSTTSGAGFQSTAITLPNTTLSQVIYSRLKAGLSGGSYSGASTAVVVSSLGFIGTTKQFNGTVTDLPTTWDGSSWSNGAPTSSLDAIINGDFSTTASGITAEFSAKTLTVNATKTFTINPGHNITVAGAVTNNGTFTIENNANLIQVNNATNTGTGTAIVKRNSNPLKRLDYTMWSSPVSGAQTLAGFSPLTSQSPNRFYTYDSATDKYTNVAPTSTFATGTGYLIRMPNEDPTPNYGTITEPNTLAYPGVFTGALNNGNVSITTSTSGYYSVGNPYPSTIDATAFLSLPGNTTDGTLYFWRKTNGVDNTLTGSSTGTAYATWTSLGGTKSSGNVAPNDILPNGTIQVGQGFIVKSNGASLSFTNAMRLGTASTQFFKTKQVAEKSRVWLNLTNTTGAYSQALVGYLDGATLGVDNGIDGKYINDSAIALTSNINGEEYTIQGRPAFDATDVVALNFKTDVAGDYTIAIDHTDGLFATGQDIYLVDSKTGTETNLKAGSYTFTAATGVDNSRFSLKYQKTLKVDDAIFNKNDVTVYAKNGSLFVNSGEIVINSIQVYDVQGRLLAERKGVKTTTAIIENLKANNQVLLVKVLGANNKVVTKKVVN